jgi:hypothetical protein
MFNECPGKYPPRVKEPPVSIGNRFTPMAFSKAFTYLTSTHK